MKNCSLIIVIISVCLSCGVVDLSGLPIPNTNPTNNTPSLSNDEVIKGLKEALTVGIQNSVNVTGVTDGFLKNGEIRLPFPPDALKVKEKALSLGMQGQVEKFETTLNRAAEEAVNTITTIFEKEVPCTYIADGHHRAASAAKVRAALGDNAGPEADGFLTTLFPADELKIMPYNRVVKDLNGMEPSDLISALQEDFMVSSSEVPVSPAHLHEFGMYMEGEWYHLTAIEGTYTDDPIGILDVSIFSRNILEKLLDIEDQRTDKRIDFVGGIRGLKELEKRVDSGEMKVAFSFYPVSIGQLFDIADSGNVMPPKSTWFEPKLRDGLLTHLI